MHPRLYEVLRGFSVAMIVTHGIDGTMIARPMTVARIDRGGRLYFATLIESTKVDEVLADPHVTVVFQSKAHYVAVRGVAHISFDRALLASLWQEVWRTFFPAGRDDPSLAILIVDPRQADTWDVAQQDVSMHQAMR